MPQCEIEPFELWARFLHDCPLRVTQEYEGIASKFPLGRFLTCCGALCMCLAVKRSEGNLGRWVRTQHGFVRSFGRSSSEDSRDVPTRFGNGQFWILFVN